jgi:hypothetical protein
MTADRLQRVLDRLDALNREDPHVEEAEGASRPRELVYAERLTGWVLRLNPQASETLRIAARGQHVRRWTIPRERYERSRRGYLKWRETLKTMHAETVAGVMQAEGYDEAAIARVRRIIGKKDLGGDPDTQTIEDALCLLFLETQFHDLRRKTPEATMRQVLRKTWGKMSERARAEALRLPLATEDRTALEQALVG